MNAAQSFSSLRQSFPREFWVLWVGTLINRIGEFVVPLLGFYLTARQHMSVGQVSVILSALGIGRFVAEGLSGTLADRFGAVFAMRLALAGGGVMLLLLAQAQTFPALFAGVLAYSLFTAMYKPAASTAVADMLGGAKRTQGYNLIYWAINVGTSISPILGGFLAGWSFKLLFYLDAATMFIYSLLLTAFVKLPKRQHTHAQKGGFLPRDSLLWQFCLATLLYSLTYQSYKMLALVFAQQGFSAIQYGQMLSINGVMVVLLGLPIGSYIAHRADSRWQALGAALLGAGFLVHAFAPSLLVHGLAVVIWTLGEIISYSISKTVISELAPAERRGTYIGLVGSMSGLATLGAPLLGGFLLTHYGNQALWLGIASLSMVAAGLYMVLNGRISVRREQNALA